MSPAFQSADAGPAGCKARFDVADVLGGGALTFLATLVVFALASGRKGMLGRSSRHLPTGAAAGAAAGLMLLASAGFTSVEYDTDVPQFDEVFYLPVLGFATRPRGWVRDRARSTEQTVWDPNRYAYFPSEQSSGTVKLVASLLLYAALLALLYATFALIRRNLG